MHLSLLLQSLDEPSGSAIDPLDREDELMADRDVVRVTYVCADRIPCAEEYPNNPRSVSY